MEPPVRRRGGGGARRRSRRTALRARRAVRARCRRGRQPQRGPSCLFVPLARDRASATRRRRAAPRLRAQQCRVSRSREMPLVVHGVVQRCARGAASSRRRARSKRATGAVGAGGRRQRSRTAAPNAAPPRPRRLAPACRRPRARRVVNRETRGRTPGRRAQTSSPPCVAAAQLLQHELAVLRICCAGGYCGGEKR